MTAKRLGLFVPVLVAIVVAVAWSAASADEPTQVQPPAAQEKPKLPDRKKIMADKLVYAQQILNGLALNDSDTVKKSGEKLLALSQLAEWLNADKTDEYQFQMNVFQRATKRIIKKAGEKNIDGVMLAYTEMTQACLRCHQVERDFR